MNKFLYRSYYLVILRFSFLIGIIFGGCTSHNTSGNKQSVNSVAEFLNQSELQAETDDQVQQIKIALSDMLKYNKDELQNKKYPDYENNPNQWDIVTLLNSYYVPAQQKTLHPETFYNDFDKPESHKIIQDQINKINSFNQNNSDSTNNQK